ncbi:ribonuclease E inhibitor RraB [Pedobacter sp. B4-66]|uniref:ribonuclease E inhibitor RraB n=1 Tax=Pedobacter sp. B4-66 TaxID=2817280 RepID=UPI001BD9DDB4|nr:ribonuclease E inhibitor RraB [Pedobacter sp. B4-66]
MTNTFFTLVEFNENYSEEISSATDVYERRKADGMRDFSLSAFEFVFTSDSKTKLQKLGQFLSTNYNYEIGEISEEDDDWELNGVATEFPVDHENLVYWVLNMYCKGHKFDCKLEGYGAFDDPAEQTFPDMDAGLYSHYFDLAMESYYKGNLGMGVIHFSTAIRIKPQDPNSWYSRAILKDELHTPKAARLDYDKAIELAPDFIDAIINRAANKDEAGEHDNAIADYSFVISLEPDNGLAHYNRANSKLRKGDKVGACLDWTKAKQLGYKYAEERLNINCA